MKISFVLYDDAQGNFLTSLGFVKTKQKWEKWEGNFDLIRNKEVEINKVEIPFTPVPIHLTIDGKLLFSKKELWVGNGTVIVDTRISSNYLYPLVQEVLEEVEEMRELNLPYSDLLKKREEEKVRQREISSFQEKISSLEEELKEAQQKIASRNRIIKQLRKIRISLSE